MTSKEAAHPNVILPRTIEGIAVSPAHLGVTMHKLHISDDTIQSTTVYIDPTNRLLTNGSTYPRLLARLRHFSYPELHNAPGPVIRISAKVRGVKRTEDEMNHTTVHELEHVAQIDRHDRRIILGNAAIWGFTLAGAYIGSRLSGGKAATAAAVIGGAAIGQQVGYAIAPHERNARAVADKVSTTAITRE